MTIDLGVATRVSAEAFGEPGQRTFRMRILGSAAAGHAALWMEKEHLRGLSLAFRQILADLGHEGESQSSEVAEFADTAAYEFRVGSIGLGFHPSDGTIILRMNELGIAEGGGPTLIVRLTRQQCAFLIPELDQIVAAGRPMCQICGLPRDPSGHVCIRSNGHSEQPIPEDSDEGDL